MLEAHNAAQWFTRYLFTIVVVHNVALKTPERQTELVPITQPQNFWRIRNGNRVSLRGRSVIITWAPGPGGLLISVGAIEFMLLNLAELVLYKENPLLSSEDGKMPDFIAASHR